MNQPRDALDSWLAAARAQLAQQNPPEWIESALAARQSERALLRRLRADQPAASVLRKSRPIWLWWGLPAGLAALLVAGVGLVFLAGAPLTSDTSAPAFMALTPLETIAAEPRPLVIASEVPRAQLAALGLPVDPARADLPVRAEFLVSQRGALLAVRFSPE
ncbi:MAG TPA: hypothetical protein VEN28_10790 [Burkholderiaceae bacterium]|nr:hypothetical protein [Burkholderiaceae bacterium]